MDPCDRLWVELIFPWCDGQALLAARAVCRAFRTQLNNSRLWLPFTMELSRMRYAERLLGWRGVLAAIKREENTRANCDAGLFLHNASFEAKHAHHLMLVGGRVVVFFTATVQLFDVDSGALVATFDVEARDIRDPLCDRWVSCTVFKRGALLLDCVAARLVELMPPDAARTIVHFSVAGPCVSLCGYNTTAITVVHVTGGSDGTTMMREVARVTMSHVRDQFELCERGRSYVMFEKRNATLKLVELATGQCKRVFTARACLSQRRYCCTH